MPSDSGTHREIPAVRAHGKALPRRESWTVPLTLLALTFLSTLFVGAGMVHGGDVQSLGGLLAPSRLLDGWVFAVPLMGILVSHEFGHFIAGRLHGIDISPPYFIPIPFFLLGTLGAVIRMRSAIERRNALLDVGAAGPLAGMVVALPVLVYGLATSPVEPLPDPETTDYLLEGRSLLYVTLLYVIKGPMPEGHDIMLNPTAFAGWAGLLVTMINLLPVGQLDGGHVAYALLGPQQDVVSERIRRGLPALGLAVCAIYGLDSYLEGDRGDTLVYQFIAGMHWLVWAAVLSLMTRMAGPQHPPTGREPLTPARRKVAVLTLGLFVVLFMPAWLRIQ